MDNAKLGPSVSRFCFGIFSVLLFAARSHSHSTAPRQLQKARARHLNAVALPLLVITNSVGAQSYTAYKEATGNAASQMYLESMYLPSVTRGPWSPAWSPNGREIAFAMHGSLWKIDVEGGEAQQITTGPDYDSEPQWSPDGRRIVFTRDNGKTMELWLVDAGGGSPSQLTHSGAINVDPEWHSTKQIFYSSNSGGDAMTLWQVADDGSGPRPILADTEQSIEPTSSPDGKWIAFVSSREVATGQPSSYGSGDIWKLNLADQTLHLLLRQETLWHTRPRWSPEGRRIVYISLQTGRNQLFLLNADTGIPVQLTYGPAEPFTPAWSPNGQRIAFISNAGRQLSLLTMSASGGAATPVKITGLRWRQPMGRLRVVVQDETGKVTGARFQIRSQDGKSWAPQGALERVSVVTGDHYFYPPAVGGFTVDLPAGRFLVEVMKGFQYHPLSQGVEIVDHQTKAISFALKRVANFDRLGWYSGDNHLHMNYGGVFGETPQSVLQEADAEDLDVVNDLTTNHNTHLIDYQYFAGALDCHSTARRMLYFNEEYRSNFGGHLDLLNIKQYYFPVYDGYTEYGSTPFAADYPSNARVLDSVHAQGGVGGYSHPYYLLDRGEDPLQNGLEGAREFPADAALGKVDFYDLMSVWSDKYVAGDVLYRVWNLGFRVPASAGTDVMADYWRSPTIGAERVVVHSGSPLNYQSWVRGLVKGRSFVTNGPLLTFTVDGHEPGEELRLPAGVASSVHFSAEAVSILPMEKLEILQDGKLVMSEKAVDPHRVRLSASLPVTHSGWIAVRVTGPEKVHLLTDSYVYAHTNPVWLVKGNLPPHSPADAEYFVRWMDTALQQIPERTTFLNDAQKADVIRVYTDARRRFSELAGRDSDSSGNHSREYQ